MNLKKLTFYRGAFLAAALGVSSANLATAAADQVATPSKDPRDRHDMVTSDDTKLNTVGKQPDASGPKVGRADRSFIEKAMRGGLLEIKAAQLAQSNAADESVKKYAQQLINDHTAANKELSDLAGRKGVSLADLDRDDHNFKSLSKKTGADFDKAYVDHAVKDHKEDIELFEKASRKSEDPDVAAYAARQLSVLHQHEQMAQDLEKSLKR